MCLLLVCRVTNIEADLAILFGEGVPSFVGILDFEGVLERSIFAKLELAKDRRSLASIGLRTGEANVIGEPGTS